MPCPHFDMKIIQRSKRQSAVASAAYIKVIQDKADEGKARQTAPAQTKHRQQDMEL